MEDDVFNPGQRMRELISSDPSLLMALTRFGISLGFADKSVDEVCTENGIDTGTFLAVANFISGHDWHSCHVCLSTLMGYLKNAHVYFLDFVLPMIRRKLIEAIDCSRADGVGFLILRFYDEYVTEVANHMEFENRKVFPYVETLLAGRYVEDFDIAKFASRHTHIAPKLKELKDIIVRYCPEKGNDLLNSVLFDIMTCERDVHMHCLAEDQLFVPAVEQLECEMAQRRDAPSVNIGTKRNPVAQSRPDLEKIASLSEREKEIVVMIAKGFANKEIADKLCLSIHTVTTHRRNISAKLQIHSPAGLAIFAIVNGLITVADVTDRF